mmetsp:Transcript_43142/g.55440  ORF Transcript_43142/g.55440 Transcript_43142/m.55440 type:complete len:94 (-) Transcript_43142:447-728(-)
MPPTASIGNWNKWMSDVENGTITLNSSNEKPDPVVKKTRRKQQTSKPGNPRRKQKTPKPVNLNFHLVFSFHLLFCFSIMIIILCVFEDGTVVC